MMRVFILILLSCRKGDVELLVLVSSTLNLLLITNHQETNYDFYEIWSISSNTKLTLDQLQLPQHLVEGQKPHGGREDTNPSFSLVLLLPISDQCLIFLIMSSSSLCIWFIRPPLSPGLVLLWLFVSVWATACEIQTSLPLGLCWRGVRFKGKHLLSSIHTIVSPFNLSSTRSLLLLLTTRGKRWFWVHSRLNI